MAEPLRLLMLCMGNICRSPAAQGVMEHLIRERGLDGRVVADSAGTIGYHAGSLPDSRMREAAARRGIRLEHRARQVRPDDFGEFDYVVAMDGDNLRSLLDHGAGARPASGRRRGQASLLLDHAPHLAVREVPDPYYGGPTGFERVFDLVEAAAQGLLDDIRARHL